MPFRLVPNPRLFALVAVAGIALRVYLIVLSGDRPEGVLGGGSDAPAYILLGHSIFHLQGMCYVGQPTALRAPLHPLILANLEVGFTSHYLLVMRLIQLGVAVLTALVCAETAQLLCGIRAKWPTFVVALSTPTLFFFTTQILTEIITAFHISLALYFLVQYSASEH
jgi:hypothetical protein